MGAPFFGRLLHGGDYNPEQWLNFPEILEEDLRLFREAHINTVTLGVFSWSMLEPRDGEFTFDWLLEIMDRLHKAGISVILATPSGARPKWMADAWPEVLRVDAERRRALFGGRHNHCYTSPVYREKVRRIDTELARRAGEHPAVIAWHISNEFGGECHCPLCQQEFRRWLQKRYQDIGKLNEAWQTVFWSHVYDDFPQIESPSPIGENGLHGLKLDWKRFVTEQTVDFARAEIQALRDAGSRKPVTANLMYDFDGLDYRRFADVLDVISWDNYPSWHKKEERITALDTAVQHDYMRSLKRQPFLLMESCPAATNWQAVSKAKRPGMLLAASLQAVAHGSDSVLYFQMRQSRGSFEKFHGAVIDHWGGDSRVLQEVAETGRALECLSEVCGSGVRSDVALIMDRESRWAMQDAAGPRNENLRYMDLFLRLYGAVRAAGVNADILGEDQSLDGYRVVILPMVYMFKEGFAEKIRAFVSGGGTLVATYWNGVVNDTDNCWLGAAPHGLTDVLGLRSKELDALYDGDCNAAAPVLGNVPGFTHTYTCGTFCDVTELTTAVPVLAYTGDFYAGEAALAFNRFGDGTAWYAGALFEERLYQDLLRVVLRDAGVQTDARALFGGSGIPEGVSVTSRVRGDVRYVFVQNFNRFAVRIPAELPQGAEVLYGSFRGKLEPLETLVVKIS